MKRLTDEELNLLYEKAENAGTVYDSYYYFGKIQIELMQRIIEKKCNHEA